MYCQRTRDTVSTVARLGHCVDDIGHWMAANRLQMNPAKTELLWAGVVCYFDTRVISTRGPSDIRWTPASFHWLRQLRRIRQSLDDGSAATLVHAFVTSRVDYCNAVYAGAPKTVTV